MTKFTEPHLEIIIGPRFHVDLSGVKEKLEAIKKSRFEMSPAEQDTIQDVTAEEVPDDETSRDR